MESSVLCFWCMFSAQVVLINHAVKWMLESQNVQSILVSFTKDVHARATYIFMSMLPSAMAAKKKKKTWLIDAESDKSRSVTEVEIGTRAAG